MNILYALHGYKPAWRIGGPALSVSAAAEALVRRGHRVTVFTTNSNQSENLDVPLNQPVDVDGVEVWYFEQRRTFERLPIPYLAQSIGYLYTPAMRSTLRRRIGSFDLVHTHMPFVYPTFLAGRSAIRARKPLFYQQRGVYDPARIQFRSLKKNIYIQAVEKPIMKKATTLIALTPHEEESYRAFAASTPVRVVPNGIDAKDYRCEPRGDSRWAKLPGIVILFLGRIHPIKGTDKLLEAFLAIAADLPDTTLVVAGNDEFDLRPKYEQLAREAGLSHRIIFPGSVSGEDKKNLLARADLFCLPSDAEGFSMAVLEAMASSTAVLLSPGCYFPDLESRRLGVVANNDPRALAGALRKWLAEPGALTAMGQRGHAVVTEEYSWDVVTDRLLDVYAEGVERHARQQLE